nr:MAG TPA: hypothetical protein [Caudoviricetes sp.]
MIFTRTYDDSLSLICETLRTYILVMPRPENASFRKILSIFQVHHKSL